MLNSIKKFIYLFKINTKIITKLEKIHHLNKLYLLVALDKLAGLAVLSTLGGKSGTPAYIPSLLPRTGLFSWLFEAKWP